MWPIMTCVTCTENCSDGSWSVAVHAGIGIYVTFGLDDRYVPKQDSLLSVSCMAGFRVLARGLFGTGAAHLRTHPRWDPRLVPACSLPVVIDILAEHARKKNNLNDEDLILIVAAFDDYNCLLDGAPGSPGPGFAERLTQELGTLMAGGSAAYSSLDSHRFWSTCPQWHLL
jgi:hypothetical protein